MMASTLLLMLGIPLKTTTTSCSKVLQGLRFPLGVSGLFTGRCVQRVPTGDSNNLVKPFMQVAIQTTRYYAHYPFVNLYIAVKFGLYLSKRYNFLSINYFKRIVSEDSKYFNLVFPADCLHFKIFTFAST